MRIMGVDDDLVNRVILRGFFDGLKKRDGLPRFEYTLCSSGMEALQKCSVEKYDVVFMDIMMPEMNGIEAIKAIREIYKSKGWVEPLCIMVTACDVRETVEKARVAGAAGYLIKPVKRDEMMDWIQVAVMNSEKRYNSSPGDIGLH